MAAWQVPSVFLFRVKMTMIMLLFLILNHLEFEINTAQSANSKACLRVRFYGAIQEFSVFVFFSDLFCFRNGMTFLSFFPEYLSSQNKQDTHDMPCFGKGSPRKIDLGRHVPDLHQEIQIQLKLPFSRVL